MVGKNKPYKRIDFDPLFIRWFDDRFPDVAYSHVVRELLTEFKALGERHPSWSVEDIMDHFTI